jgi:hypothetical protein
MALGKPTTSVHGYRENIQVATHVSTNLRRNGNKQRKVKLYDSAFISTSSLNIRYFENL